MTDNQPAKTKRKPENPFINIIFNIVIPAVVLSKLSSPGRLGPAAALLVALAFPIGYGAYDFISRKTINGISILGILSTMMTGGLGLFQVGGFWFAVKEASVPALIGGYCLMTMRSEKPLVRTMLYNDQVIDVARVDRELSSRNHQFHFDKLLNETTVLLSSSFFLSSILNFSLAIATLRSPAGTEAFNVELGKMTALSYPVIVLPCMAVTMLALWRLLNGIKKLTGLSIDDVFHGHPKKGEDHS